MVDTDQRDFSSLSAAFQQPLSAALYSDRFFPAAYFDENAWKNACLIETTTGFCLKTIYGNYTFYMKNIDACCNAVIEKIARRNPMPSEILNFFFTNFSISQNSGLRHLIPS